MVQYLSVARLHEHSTRLEIPKIKHAPTSLAASLEEYLNDKDFEINRRQYLAEREAKRNGGKSTNGTSKLLAEADSTPAKPAASNQPSAAPAKPAASAPLIDLFESIADNQQVMGQPQPQQFPPQQTSFQQPVFQNPAQATGMGFPPQQQPQQSFGTPFGQGTNPFAQMQQPPQQLQQQPQLQTQFTGAGFGGYTAQPFSPQNPSLAPIPQNGVAGYGQPTQPIQELPGYPSQTQQMYEMPTISEPLQQQPTSTNPFRQSMMPPGAGAADGKLLGNPTGAAPLSRSPTNPFARHNTGMQQPGQSPVGMSSTPFSTLPSIQEPSSQMGFAPQPPAPQPLQPAPTGTNPFARNNSPNQGAPSPQGGLTVHATGSTNPFRQSAFVNQQTGQGWQHSGNQGTLGGLSLNQVPTTSVFPRPGQQTGQYMG